MKLWFVSPDESPLASRDPSLINAIRNEMLQHLDVGRAKSPNEADAIILHESFSFKEWRYVSKLLADPVTGPYPHKAYTVNTDDIATGLLAGLYTSIPRNRFQAQCHRAVPYFWYPNEWVLKPPCTGTRKPRFLATWRGNVGSNPKLRQALFEQCQGSSTMLAEATETGWNLHGEQEKRRYVDVLREGRFSLCPAGWAPVSWRIYESMALGVSPVIIADSFVPPDGPDWDRFAIRVPENSLHELETVLSEHSSAFDKMGMLALDAWREFFEPDKVIRYYGKSLLDCIRSRSGFCSRESELCRWRSLRMRWSNRWTFLQRLQTWVSQRRFRRSVAI